MQKEIFFFVFEFFFLSYELFRVQEKNSLSSFPPNEKLFVLPLVISLSRAYLRVGVVRGPVAVGGRAGKGDEPGDAAGGEPRGIPLLEEEVERRGVVAGAEHGNDIAFSLLFRQPSDERQSRRGVLPEPAGL